MGHDVFISYNSRMKNVADQIVSRLEANNIKCWYAPRDVVGDYATSICSAIENATVFVVILDDAGSKSPHVLNEVEMAYKRITDDDADLTILPFKLDKNELSKAMQYYIHRMHWIDASNDNVNDAIEELKEKINTILRPYINRTVKERTANTCYVHTTDLELHRLEVQSEFLHRFDGDVYINAFAEHPMPNILDIGTNDGKYIMKTIQDTGDYASFLGVDYNESSIEKAKKSFANDKTSFICCNIEEEDFVNRLENYLHERCIEGFDIINISMVLLHLKSPDLLLKHLRKCLVRGGMIIIKDVDDVHKVAYPDTNGLFAKAKELSMADVYSGYRMSGRQIPTFLHKAGYRDVQLIREGINTIGMDYDDREAFFDMCFSYFEEDFTKMVADDPNSKFARESLEWIKNNYGKMQDEFVEESFFYSLGTMMFTAKR